MVNRCLSGWSSRRTLIHAPDSEESTSPDHPSDLVHANITATSIRSAMAWTGMGGTRTAKHLSTSLAEVLRLSLSSRHRGTVSAFTSIRAHLGRHTNGYR